MSTAAAHSLSRLPTRLPARNGETLNSYITRAARRAHLSERHILQLLGCRHPTLPGWLHVDPQFFTRLSHLTHQPEPVLRERLADWSEGSTPTRKGNQRTTHYTTVPGRGCPRCRAANDWARHPLADTELNHICTTHRIWAEIDEAPGLSGRPASSSALTAARRFRRWANKRRPKEAATAFNTAYAAFDRAHLSGDIGAPAMRQAWNQRIDASPSERPHLIEVTYPEIAGLAATLLSNQWLDASEGLSGHPKSIHCKKPASRREFHNIAIKVLEHTPSPEPIDVEWARNITQRSTLEFLETLSGTYTDCGQWTAERVNALIDNIRQLRSERTPSTQPRQNRIFEPW